MARLSGAARKRRRRFNAIMDEKRGLEYRVRDGGDIIDMGLAALGGLTAIMGPNENLHLVKGADLAILIDLVINEIRLGREVQTGEFTADAA